MKKKTLFALLLAAVMLLSGCSLVLKDSAVDAKQTIIDVNGEQVDKQTFLNAYNYTLTMQQYDAQMLQQFGGDATLMYYTTDEAKEGRDAFKEKRKPNFKQFPKFP